MTEITPPPQVWPTLRARNAVGLIRFLVDVVGFDKTVVYADGEVVHHAELAWPPGGGVMLGSTRPDQETDQWPVPPGSFGAYLVTDTPDALYQRVRTAGAQIIMGLHDTEYGSRDFAIRDPEGNRWSFGTYRGAPRTTDADSPINRFRQAVRDRDVQRAGAQLTDDVQLFNPMSGEPLVGRQPVTAALTALDAVFDVFEHVDSLHSQTGKTHALRFRATIGEHLLDGVDLLELDAEGRIASLTVLARPQSGLHALAAALAAHRSQA